MSIEEENKVIERRYLEEVWNKGNLELMDEFVAPDCIYHGPGGMEIKGIEGIKQLAGMIRATFPDMHFTVEDMAAEGNIVMYRYSSRGTYQGKEGKTGTKIQRMNMILDRFEDSKIIETWEVADRLSLYQQLGLPIPSR